MSKSLNEYPHCKKEYPLGGPSFQHHFFFLNWLPCIPALEFSQFIIPSDPLTAGFCSAHLSHFQKRPLRRPTLDPSESLFMYWDAILFYFCHRIYYYMKLYYWFVSFSIVSFKSRISSMGTVSFFSFSSFFQVYPQCLGQCWAYNNFYLPNEILDFYQEEFLRNNIYLLNIAGFKFLLHKN